MKRSSCIIVLILVGLFTVSIVGAQEETEAGNADLVGYIVQTALSGEFVDNDDATYSLILASVAEYNSWIVSAPEFVTANHSLAEFASDWSFDDELTAQAVLQLDGMAISLTLYAPVYYLLDGSLSFTASIDEIVTDTPVPAKGGLVAPTTFDFATLIIHLDGAFADQYLAAREARLLETRNSEVVTCQPAVLCN